MSRGTYPDEAKPWGGIPSLNHYRRFLILAGVSWASSFRVLRKAGLVPPGGYLSTCIVTFLLIVEFHHISILSLDRRDPLSQPLNNAPMLSNEVLVQDPVLQEVLRIATIHTVQPIHLLPYHLVIIRRGRQGRDGWFNVLSLYYRA